MIGPAVAAVAPDGSGRTPNRVCLDALDEAMRVRLATHPETSHDLLRALADDPVVLVRAAVALNPSYSEALHDHLVGDADERVRALLARKVARLLPDLSGPDQLTAQAHAHRTLLCLASDAALRVRETLSDVLRSMPEAPRGVILGLAQDLSASVSEPVLRLSPLLTETDLLELLASPPHPTVARAVASRARVGAAVADCIAAQADGTAIRTLLENKSAVIRETTLEGLIGRAGEHPDWHEPLVQRPWLAEQAARALSLIVADHLLKVLLDRTDLSPVLAEEIRLRLGGPADGPVDEQEQLDRLAAQHARRPFTEASITDAANRAEPRRIAMMLAITAGVRLMDVDRAVALHNAKALVSLVWRAGFSMQAAILVQTALGCLSPGQVLRPVAHGAFPLCINEMEWQIELLTGRPA